MSGAQGPLVAAVHEETGEILETEELRTQGLAQFRALIAAQQAKKPFPEVRTDDAFLLAFLRARKYELPRALKVLLTFSEFWHLNPALLEGLTLADVRPTYELGMVRCLDTQDIHGNTVQLIDMGKMDYSKFTPSEMARMAFVIGLAIFEDSHLQTHGVTYCETLEGFSMLKAAMTVKKQGDPAHKKLLSFGVDTIPMRIRALYVVQQPTWFSWFWGLIKFFFKKKLRDRLVLLGTDYARLHAIVPAAGLPTGFAGGTLTEPPFSYLDRLEAKVAAAGGMLGGFMLPLSLSDPTGEKRRAAAAAAAGGEGATVLQGGGSGSSSSSSSAGAAAEAPFPAPAPSGEEAAAFSIE